MAIINLRDYYPFYTSDCFMEVSEEVAEMFKEFDRKEAAYRLRTYRHKAYYSLDRDDGLEHEAVFVALSPHELYERKVTMQELHAAIASLPNKQAKRIYAHRSQCDLACPRRLRFGHSSTHNRNGGKYMAIINLRDYYPFYTSDCFMEVSEEVAEMFKEFDRKEAAYRLRTYRHKAYYFLDRDDGLEHEAVFVALSPHELYERKVTMQELHAAIASLPNKQAKRIYAHRSQCDLACLR